MKALFWLLFAYGLPTLAADSIEEALKERYALMTFKQQKLGRTEAPPASASLNEFRRYIASFRDTHLRLDEETSPVWIFNGLSLALVRERILVDDIDQRLGSPALNSIEIGDELESIDAQSALLLAQKLAPYISSSSDEHRMQLAVQSLGTRNFLYPQSHPEKWRFFSRRRKKTLLVPLSFYANAVELNQNPSARALLAKVRILPTSHLARFKDPPRTGFAIERPRIWENSSREPVLTLGKLKGLSYLKLDEFDESPLQSLNESSTALKLIKSVGASGKLILDLRHNGGGSGDVGTALFESLMPQKAGCFFWSTKYRNSAFYRDLYQKTRDRFSSSEQDTIHQMIASGGEYSRFSLKSACGKNPKPLRLVVLVGAECISTCDIVARLLKTAGAKLVGQATNGTGSGFNAGGDFKFWKASSKSYRVRIPVYLIGPTGLASNPPPASNTLQSELLVENHPVEPDIKVEETPEEFTERDMSPWTTAIEKAFN